MTEVTTAKKDQIKITNNTKSQNYPTCLFYIYNHQQQTHLKSEEKKNANEIEEVIFFFLYVINHEILIKYSMLLTLNLLNHGTGPRPDGISAANSSSTRLNERPHLIEEL